MQVHLGTKSEIVLYKLYWSPPQIFHWEYIDFVKFKFVLNTSETLAHVMLFQNQIIPQCDQALCCTKQFDVHLSQEGIGPLD